MGTIDILCLNTLATTACTCTCACMEFQLFYFDFQLAWRRRCGQECSSVSYQHSLPSGRKKEKKEDLHECEGFLFKKGGIVKNWKLRYFVLDAKKKYVSVQH